ncbi:MAG TPA: hypothetical protein VHX38_16860 [Pseudonocardiaceae bacterium]|nr:hypothetical protein [Pseudonocardiaceae bacterium]
MGDGYQIDLGAMDQLVTTLKAAAQTITDANTALQNASADQLGNDALNGAGRDFKDRWDYGTGQISDLTGKMTGALSATVQAYQDVETEIAKSFTSQQPSAPSTTPGTSQSAAGSAPPAQTAGSWISALNGDRAS